MHRFFEHDVKRKYCYDKNTEIHREVRKKVVRSDTFYQYRRVCVRENKKNECQTLTANMGKGGDIT